MAYGYALFLTPHGPHRRGLLQWGFRDGHWPPKAKSGGIDWAGRWVDVGGHNDDRYSTLTTVTACVLAGEGSRRAVGQDPPVPRDP